MINQTGFLDQFFLVPPKQCFCMSFVLFPREEKVDVPTKVWSIKLASLINSFLSYPNRCLDVGLADLKNKVTYISILWNCPHVFVKKQIVHVASLKKKPVTLCSSLSSGSIQRSHVRGKMVSGKRFSSLRASNSVAEYEFSSIAKLSSSQLYYRRRIKL